MYMGQELGHTRIMGNFLLIFWVFVNKMNNKREEGKCQHRKSVMHVTSDVKGQ